MLVTWDIGPKPAKNLSLHLSEISPSSMYFIPILGDDLGFQLLLARGIPWSRKYPINPRLWVKMLTKCF